MLTLNGSPQHGVFRKKQSYLPLQQQLKIKSDGRPTPKLELRTEMKKGGIQTFSEENDRLLVALNFSGYFAGRVFF